MQRIRARVWAEFEACDLPKAGAVGQPSKAADGCFEVDFDAALALDIDTTELALLEASAPALRDALSSRLGRVAREHALCKAGPGGYVAGPSTPYPYERSLHRPPPKLKMAGADQAHPGPGAHPFRTGRN
jgi:hypothetical protein